MNTDYGFSIENYEEWQLQTLKTGDGKSKFFDMIYPDCVAIGIAYNESIEGVIGEKTDYNQTAMAEMKINWQIKFTNQKSIDSMIETLLRVKNQLAKLEANQPKRDLEQQANALDNFNIPEMSYTAFHTIGDALIDQAKQLRKQAQELK